MEYLPALILLTFASCFTLAYSVMSIIGRDELVISSRLQSISNSRAKNEDTELDQPLISRVIEDQCLIISSKAMMRITPREMVSSLENKINKAGNHGNLAVKDWVNIQAVLVIGIPMLTYIALRNTGISMGSMLLFLVAEAAIGFVLPGFILGKILTARQKKILNTLPDVYRPDHGNSRSRAGI